MYRQWWLLTPLATLVHTDAHAATQELSLHSSQTPQDLIWVLPRSNRAPSSLSAMHRQWRLCFCWGKKTLSTQRVCQLYPALTQKGQACFWQIYHHANYTLGKTQQLGPVSQSYRSCKYKCTEHLDWRILQKQQINPFKSDGHNFVNIFIKPYSKLLSILPVTHGPVFTYSI